MIGARKILQAMLAAAMLQQAPIASAQALGPHERAYCVDQASARYGVPRDLILAIIRTEGGTTGRTVGNTNGSRDMGLMQINTIHLPDLAKLGISREMVINNECLNIQIGTFILHRELARGGDYWTNVGAYNSRTPRHNAVYREKVWANLQRIWSAN